MGLKTSIDEIETVERALEEITAGLSMGAGSVLRVASQYLEGWGVGITEGNRTWIEQRSKESYFSEWEGGNNDYNEAIERAIRNAGIENGNRSLNTTLASVAVKIIITAIEQEKFSESDPFVICDLGAGDGKTTLAILTQMATMKETRILAKFCRFYLIEPSIDQLKNAEKSLEQHEIGLRNADYELVRSDVNLHLPKIRDGNFNMIISNAALHHFPFMNHWHEINRVLSKEGIAVIGDWHNNVFRNPSYVVPILKAMNANENKIQRFMSVFGIIREDSYVEIDRQLSHEKREANKMFLDYIMALVKEMKDVRDNSRHCFLEALETHEERLGKMQQAGLVTDLSELLEKHYAFAKIKSNIMRAVKPSTDVACVIAAAKIRK